MVRRIFNIGKWAPLVAGQVLQLESEQAARKVRVELNVSVPTVFHWVECERRGGEVVAVSTTLLARIDGQDVIEFTAGPLGQLVGSPEHDEGEVWYFTNDGDNIAYEPAVQPKSFVKIANRRVRNPEMERIMFKMEQNMRRRLSHLDAELAALNARVQEAEDAGADVETGELPAGGETPNDAGAAGDAGGGGEPAPGGAGAAAAAGAAGSA